MLTATSKPYVFDVMTSSSSIRASRPEAEISALKLIYGEANPDLSVFARAVEGAGRADLRSIVASTHRRLEDRCFAAWKLDDEALWARLFADPEFTAQREFIAMCFANYRLGKRHRGSFQAPSESRDDFRVELEGLLARLISEIDAERQRAGLSPRGRLSWRDVKKRFPHAKRNLTLRAIFQPALEKNRTYVLREDLRAVPRSGRFEVTSGDFLNLSYLRKISTFRVAEPQWVVALNTTPQEESEMAADPMLRSMLAGVQMKFAMNAKNGREFPAHRNSVAWVRFDTVSIPGAFLIEEVQSLIVQLCDKSLDALRRLTVFQGRSDEELAAFQTAVAQRFVGWSDSAMCTALHAARLNGCREVYFRSPADLRHVSRKIMRSTLVGLYKELPRRYGFRACGEHDCPAERGLELWHRRL